MHPSLSVGYQGAGFDSPAYKLSEVFGDRLEKINSGDKLALIATLAVWLSEDDEDYEIPHAVTDCPMCVSESFFLYIAILSSEETPLSPNDALNLIAALTAQLKSGVYAQ